MAGETRSTEPDAARRKRPRAARACQFCRAKKYKCDELRPCAQCRRSNIDCVYETNEQIRLFVDQNVRTDANLTGHNPNDSSVPQREFHGQTSSMAFLAALDSEPTCPNTPLPQRAGTFLQNETFVPTIQNDGFSPAIPKTTPEEDALLQAERFYFKHSHIFLQGHFQNIHFVHPILDKAIFMNRCEDLWFGTSNKHSRSFIALYYSVMSLGALIRNWDDDRTIDNKGRLEWSRKLFDLASIALAPVRLCIDLETIQACFFMAKVCQNELNPSLAYMYLGLAARSSFAAGINRRPRNGEILASSEDQELAQRTWWGLYALEIELSFALGRPDSLGPDQYHNLELPNQDMSEIAIIPALVQLARIIRRVCTEVYLSGDTLDTRINRALSLNKELDAWITNLPESLRPDLYVVRANAKITNEPRSSKLQKLVISFRYYNVKMILLRPFLAKGTINMQPLPLSLSSIINKCVDAGRDTITHMHDIYVHQPFFRSWWNNTTYILYAVSTVLWYTVNVASLDEVPMLLELGDKAIDILEAMEESVVARKACDVIKGFALKARQRFEPATHPTQMKNANPRSLHLDDPGTRDNSFEAAGDTLFQELDLNLDFFDMTFPMDEMRSVFWRDNGEEEV